MSGVSRPLALYKTSSNAPEADVTASSRLRLIVANCAMIRSESAA
jgi:hypothetical protein